MANEATRYPQLCGYLREFYKKFSDSMADARARYGFAKGVAKEIGPLVDDADFEFGILSWRRRHARMTDLDALFDTFEKAAGEERQAAALGEALAGLNGGKPRSRELDDFSVYVCAYAEIRARLYAMEYYADRMGSGSAGAFSDAVEDFWHPRNTAPRGRRVVPPWLG